MTKDTPITGRPYDNCQYCGTPVDYKLRKKYSDTDGVWFCPACDREANVTAYANKPTGLVAVPEIRKIRKLFYEACWGALSPNIGARLCVVFLKTLAGTAKTTQIDDDKLVELWDAWVQAGNNAKLKELQAKVARAKQELNDAERELFKQQNHLKDMEVRVRMENLPEEVRKAFIADLAKSSARSVKDFIADLYEQRPQLTSSLYPLAPTLGLSSDIPDELK